jgi:hypothetical protein
MVEERTLFGCESIINDICSRRGGKAFEECPNRPYENEPKLLALKNQKMSSLQLRSGEGIEG